MMRHWQQFLEEKLRQMAEAECVYDIGGGATPSKRRYFKKYVVVDINGAVCPDVVADVQALPFAEGALEAVLCFSVLEHVENPFRAAAELYRVLKPGGALLLSVPFIWPYHAASAYKDYWRMSEDALRVLFAHFSQLEIIKAGGYFSALANFIPSSTRLDRLARPIARWLDRFSSGRGSTTPAYYVFAKK